MGMDGLSMANTGILREATSRDYAAQTDEAIHKEDKNKQVDQLQTQMRVKEDGHNSSKEGKKKKEDEEDDEASVYEPETTSSQTNDETIKFSEEDLENHTFYVKISKDGNIFELYDKDSERLIEKISAEEINQLMLKLNMASGILVNRSV